MRTFLEVGSLRETKLTGIGETIARLCECALAESDVENYRFCIGGSEIHRDIISEVVETNTGAILGAYLAGGYANSIALSGNQLNSGIFLHRAPAGRIFDHQTQIIYDLTPLICAQYHSKDVVRDFSLNFKRECVEMDALVTISDAVLEDLVSYFPEFRGKSTASSCGVNSRMQQVSPLKLPQKLMSEPYFVSLGTLEPRKNNILTLKMLSAYPNLLKSFRFLFVGKQGWGRDFDDIILELGLSEAVRDERIVRTGFVHDDMKRTLLQNAEALIYPTHYEGFGLPVLEAYAVGKPVICQPTTSLPQVAGDLAYYINSPTPAGLFSAVRQLLADGERRSPQALRNHAERFTWQAMWDDIRQPAAKIDTELEYA